MIAKITSRKFWLSTAAFLASIGTSIAGVQTSNTKVATVGIVCAVLSAAIYSAVEAYVDAKSVVTEVAEETLTRSDDDRSDEAEDLTEGGE